MNRDEWAAVLYEAEEFMGGPATLPNASASQDDPPPDAYEPP